MQINSRRQHIANVTRHKLLSLSFDPMPKTVVQKIHHGDASKGSNLSSIFYWLSVAPLLALFALASGGVLLVALSDVVDGNHGLYDDNQGMLAFVLGFFGSPVAAALFFRGWLQRLHPGVLLIAGAGTWTLLYGSLYSMLDSGAWQW